MPLTRSASLEMGALLSPASFTSFTMRLRVLSSPTLVARMRKDADGFMLPAISSSPSCLSTGTLSPVMWLWSSATVTSDQLTSTFGLRHSSVSQTSPPCRGGGAASYPSSTPSTGMRSPGRISSTSPICTSAVLITSSASPRMTVTSSGVSAISFSMAAVVFFLARASKNLPSVISVNIITADSKYSSIA